jgi:poly(A) polymerase Pap1
VASTAMVFTRINMANPDQKTILIEQTSKDIIEICKKFQDDSGSSNSEVMILLREIARLWETEEKNKFGFR